MFFYVILKVHISIHTTRKYARGLEVKLHSFLTSALDRNDWSAQHPNPTLAVTPRKAPLPRYTQFERATGPNWIY
jgi:hypothetical protein